MFVYAKIGTWPAGYYKAIKKRKTPKVGDILILRGHEAWEDQRVSVTDIKDVQGDSPLYLVERL